MYGVDDLFVGVQFVQVLHHDISDTPKKPKTMLCVVHRHFIKWYLSGEGFFSRPSKRARDDCVRLYEQVSSFLFFYKLATRAMALLAEPMMELSSEAPGTEGVVVVSWQPGRRGRRRWQR
ncbi:uncharacterized protein LY79DRAFT_247662 [Colletotrichum navitas]|uniref:Uncharacterized protein n=1 Tax=Colletotrichum navitas TaxID=681940 RepID=A0AAD8Q9L9_9PEZI|nr:uncharacterized protein LY79DRAFT_247662 [Colletotrichum navitas]KAK1598553.1 hypothetical protein LY79DRAFT_247662 [Colletotrichum navitas]